MGLHLKNHGNIDFASVVKKQRWMNNILHIDYGFIFVVRGLISIIYRVFVSSETYYFIHQGNAKRKVLFIFCHDINTFRSDCTSMFMATAKVLDSKDYDLIGLKHSNKYHILSFIHLTKLISSWIRELKNNNIGIYHSIEILREAIDCYYLRIQLDSLINTSSIKLSVFFYDADSRDNYCSQYLQDFGIPTATLQHGIQLAPRKGLEDNIDFAGIEFGCFISNYYLAWNEFTRQEAIKAGIKDNQIKVLGISKCIGKNPLLKKGNSNVIGLILDGKYEEENNIPMIRLLNQLCVKYNIKYKLRYHPDYKGTEYLDYIDARYCIATNKRETLNDFLSSVKLCIVANSTVLFELEFYSVPFIRYSSGNLKDKFVGYSGISFNNYEELEKCYLSIIKECVIVPRYMENIAYNYRRFFESFLSCKSNAK